MPFTELFKACVHACFHESTTQRYPKTHLKQTREQQLVPKESLYFMLPESFPDSGAVFSITITCYAPMPDRPVKLLPMPQATPRSTRTDSDTPPSGRTAKRSLVVLTGKDLTAEYELEGEASVSTRLPNEIPKNSISERDRERERGRCGMLTWCCRALSFPSQPVTAWDGHAWSMWAMYKQCTSTRLCLGRLSAGLRLLRLSRLSRLSRLWRLWRLSKLTKSNGNELSELAPRDAAMPSRQKSLGVKLSKGSSQVLIPYRGWQRPKDTVQYSSILQLYWCIVGIELVPRDIRAWSHTKQIDIIAPSLSHEAVLSFPRHQSSIPALSLWQEVLAASRGR